VIDPERRTGSLGLDELLAERLRQVRLELFGEGVGELACRLRIPGPSWMLYESGAAVPADVLLKFVELTSVEPIWLLRGWGPRFRGVPIRRGFSRN